MTVNTMPKVEPSEEVREYLEQKGWWPPPHKSEEPDHVYLDCPFCKSGRLTMQVELGLWDCKSCGEQGNVLGMKRRLGDLYSIDKHGHKGNIKGGLKGSSVRPPVDIVEDMAQRLWDDPDAEPVRKYLTMVRCIPEDVLRRFRVGAARRHGKWWFSLVAFGPDELPSFLKFRTVPPAGKEFRRYKGCTTTIFGPAPGMKLDKEQPLIIVEGECEVLAMVAFGLTNVITGTAGATGGFPEEWIKLAKEFPHVHLALDRGSEGERGSEKLANAIGIARCSRVRPPDGMKDWNECLSAGMTIDDISPSFEDAERYTPDKIKDVSAYRAEIVARRMDPDGTKGLTLGFGDSLDMLFRVRPGELTGVTGDTGSGKTTFGSALCWNMTRIHGWPGLIVTLENSPGSVVEKWARMEAGEDVTDAEAVSEKQFLTAMDALESLPLYVLDHYGDIDIDRLCDTVRWAVEAEGVRYFWLDHLHYALGVGGKDDERHNIDKAIKSLNKVCVETGVHGFVTVHPRNVDGDNVRVQMHHLKGSSGIKQECHNIMAVWRRRSADRSKPNGNVSKAVVTVLKHRSEQGEEGSAILKFDRHSLRYSEYFEIGGATSSDVD